MKENAISGTCALSLFFKKQDLKILKFLLRKQSKLLFQIKKFSNPENREKSRNNPEKNPETG